MTDQPVPPLGDTEPEDLLPEDVGARGDDDIVASPPPTRDELRVWQQKSAQSFFDQPVHPPSEADPDQH